MTWRDSFRRATRYTGAKLRTSRSQPESSASVADAWDECSKAYLIESSRWRNSRVRNALEYLRDLEADPDADDFAIAWASHELQRRMRAAKEDILRDG